MTKSVEGFPDQFWGFAMVIDSKPLPSKTKDGFMVIGLVFIPHVKIYPPKAEASLPNQPFHSWRGWTGLGRGKKSAFLKKKSRGRNSIRTGPIWTDISAFWTDISAFRTGWLGCPRESKPKNASTTKKSPTIYKGNSMGSSATYSGKTARHSAGKFKCLLPRTYWATSIKRPSDHKSPQA